MMLANERVKGESQRKKKVPVVSECRTRRASSSLWMLCGVGGVLTDMQNRQKEHKGFSVMWNSGGESVLGWGSVSSPFLFSYISKDFLNHHRFRVWQLKPEGQFHTSYSPALHSFWISSVKLHSAFWVVCVLFFAYQDQILKPVLK